MKYRLIQYVDGSWLKSEFDDENLIPAMEIRGFDLAGVNNNPRHRAELQGAPRFAKLVGPMWDGDAIRYEDPAANDVLST